MACGDVFSSFITLDISGHICRLKRHGQPRRVAGWSGGGVAVDGASAATPETAGVAANMAKEEASATSSPYPEDLRERSKGEYL